MFKKSERLSRLAFTTYFKIGRRFNSDAFTLIYTPTPIRAVAVVVGKKVYKSAVDRNTLRRRVYATMRQQLTDKTGVYIVIAKPAAKNLTAVDATSTILSLLATQVKSR